MVATVIAALHHFSREVPTRRGIRFVAAVSALALLLVATVPAQIITASLVGTVKDPSDFAIDHAKMTLIHIETGSVRSVMTDEKGNFIISGIDPGDYNLSAEKAGFKKAVRTQLRIETGERLTVGTMALEIGSVNQAVEVIGTATPVQTESTERAGVIGSEQVANLLNLGRNVVSLVSLQPGVVVGSETGFLDRTEQLNVLGGRITANTVAVDGIPSTDLDGGVALKLAIGEDAVSEVHILLSNYQAEYGRSSGANVQIVMKSGTRDLHGLGSYFIRNEDLNANSFFNNRLGLARAPYRYNISNYNIGGPITIPGVFNRNRDKLFFFWSQEFWLNKQGATLTATMPTALERAGDYSQSVDLNNRMVVVKDPFNGSTPFPGNRIPTNRLDPNGTALLNVFAAPNYFDRNISHGSYNYVFQGITNQPKLTDSLKVNYNVNESNQFSATFETFHEVTDGPTITLVNTTWPQMPANFTANTKGWAGRYMRIFTPNLINEFQFGWFHNPEVNTYSQADLARNQTNKIGYAAARLFPSTDPLDIIPNATFGGVTGAATLNLSARFPQNDSNDLASWNDKITWTHEAHTVKAGVYLEQFWRDISASANYRGSYAFGTNASNPLDTGYAYANASLGVFANYTEASRNPRQLARGGRAEWFLQDNWKVRKNLTLEFGMRFCLLPPVDQANGPIAGFSISQYQAGQQVRLIQPGFNAQKVRIGVDPVTGQQYSAGLIGAMVPGVGNAADGVVVASKTSQLIVNRGVQFAPRFGFAWDPFHNGKTSIRGGFGMFYNPLNVSEYRPYVAQPPVVQTPTVYYGQISALGSSQGFLFPTSVAGIDRNAKVPSTMNFSFSIQRDIGFGTVVDVAYVGSLSRNLAWVRDLNAIPLGSDFAPANQDPTSLGHPLAPGLLYPIRGYTSIPITETASSSNYHSLQVTANRRFRHGLEFGMAWTWSKAMDFADTDATTVDTLLPMRLRNYGLASFDRTHVLKVNALWRVPKLTLNRLAGYGVNGWQLAAIPSFISGQPLAIGFTSITAIDITGSSSEAPRVNVIANPVLDKSQRTFYRNFNTNAFQMPAVGTVGNAARTEIRGPGINNFDLALFKEFPVRESMRFQLRADAYNAFNHTQFSALDTTARFDASGNQVNQDFGAFTAARAPRTMQISLRFSF
jgi:hypothetical protein